MSDSDQRVEKIKLPVEIERNGGVSSGFVFLMPQSRLSDLMNDSRKFLPFETHSGKFSAISKSDILSITPLDEVQKEKRYEGDNPYRILGVSEDAALDDIRQAYLRLCAEHHPDRIKGMGLSAEYVELANTHMARVNDAFQRINGQRETNGHAHGSMNGYAHGSANGFDRGADDERDNARKAEEERAARKAEEERAARKAEERLARLAEAEAAREAEVIELARKAAEEKTARMAQEEADRIVAAEEEAKRSDAEAETDHSAGAESEKRKSPGEEIGQRAESAVLRAQAEIARKVEARAARMAQEDQPARTPKSAPKSAADSLRRAAHDLAREKEKKAF